MAISVEMNQANLSIEVHQAPILFTIVYDAQYKISETFTSLEALPASALKLTFGNTLVVVTNIVNFLKEIAHLLLTKYLFDKEHGKVSEIIVIKPKFPYDVILNNNGCVANLSFIEIQLLVLNLNKLLDQAALKESTCNSIASNISVCYATMEIVKLLIGFCEDSSKYILFSGMSRYPSPETERILIRAIESESPNSKSLHLLSGFEFLRGQEVERKLLSFFNLTQDITLRQKILSFATNNGFELEEWLNILRQQLDSDEKNFELPYGSIRPLLNSGIHIERIIQHYHLQENWHMETLVSLSVYCAANNIKSSSLLLTEDVLNINIRNIYTDSRYGIGAFCELQDIYPESSHWDIVRSFINHELEFIRTKGFRILSALVKEKINFNFTRLDDGQYVKIRSNVKHDLKIPEDIYSAVKQACDTLMVGAIPLPYEVLFSIARLDYYSLDATLFIIDKVNSSKNIQGKITMAGYALHRFSKINQKNLLRAFIIDHLKHVEQPDIPFGSADPRIKDPEIINWFIEKHQKVDSEQGAYLLEQGLHAIAYS